MKAKILIPIFVMILLAVQAFAFTASGTVTGTSVGALVNANVTAYQAGTVNQVNSTLTDGSGQYSLDVGTGLIFLNATTTGFDEQGYPKFVSADYSQDFNLGPISSVILNGTVSNSTGPIQNANVLLESNTYAPVNVQTDANGYYETSVVDSLTYSVTVSASGHNNANANVVISGNTTRDFTLTPVVTVGNVSGKVTDFVTGANLSGASVRATQNGATFATTISDANGDYNLASLQPGTYNITASLAGYSDDTQSTDVIAGSSSTVNLQLVALGAVCTETIVDSGYGACQNDGFKYKTITTYNESGVCGITNVTTERTSCEGGGSSPTSSRRSPSGVNPYITSFTNYVTQIWSPLVSGKDYTMKIANDEIAIYEVTFSVKQDFANAIISLGLLIDEPKDAYDGEVYQYGDIKHDDIPNSAVNYAKIKFKVKNQWFDDNGLDKETVALYRYQDKKWQKLDTEDIGTDKKYSYFEAYSPGLSIYAISADKFKIEEPIDVEPEPVVVGLSEEEVQELMDACRENGLKPVSVIDEDGNILDIECQEQEEEISAIGRAWAVFTGFAAANYGWIILVIVIIVLVILYVLYRETVHSWFARDAEEAKDEKVVAKKESKEPKRVQETLDSLKTSWWSRLFTRVDDEWFDKDVLNKKQYIARRKRERLERRKKYLK